MKQRHARLEKSLLGLILLMLVTPGLLTLFFYYHTGPLPPWTNWLANRTLRGWVTTQKPVPLSREEVWDGKYQKALAAQFDESFAGRELLIRATDETWFRVLRTSLTASTEIQIGPDDSLVTPGYLVDYCLRRPTRETLMPLVTLIKQFQEECTGRGTAFVLLITPNKSAIYPEGIPARWMARNLPGPHTIEVLVPLLKEQGIHFVDGHAVAMEAKSRFTEARVFPVGSVHWGALPILLCANALIAELKAQGLDLEPLDEAGLHVTREHADDTDDLVQLMNVAIPWHYPVYAYTSTPVAHRKNYTMATMGGSFMWFFLRTLSRSCQFSEIDSYYYYTMEKYCVVDGENNIISKPAAPIHFSTDIYAADCVMLEMNEQQVNSPDNAHRRFLRDALANLPKEGAAREAFHFEKLLPYAWGEEISFAKRGIGFAYTPALSGFGGAEPVFAWTQAQDAVMRLLTPPADRDVVLEATAGALLDPKWGTGQLVTIFVNEEEVGRWQFDDLGTYEKKLTIPGKLVAQGGPISLRFHVARPVTPKELGMGEDPRTLGFRMSTLRLGLAGDAAQ